MIIPTTVLGDKLLPLIIFIVKQRPQVHVLCSRPCTWCRLYGDCTCVSHSAVSPSVFPSGPRTRGEPAAAQHDILCGVCVCVCVGVWQRLQLLSPAHPVSAHRTRTGELGKAASSHWARSATAAPTVSSPFWRACWPCCCRAFGTHGPSCARSRVGRSHATRAGWRSDQGSLALAPPRSTLCSRCEAHCTALCKSSSGPAWLVSSAR